MKEHGFIARQDEVPNILSGAQTQFCRPVKLTDFQPCDFSGGSEWLFRDKRDCWNDVSTERLIEKWCPFGAPGDLLWLRETWHQHYAGGILGGRPCYKADGNCDGSGIIKWRPSSQMPHWASRMTLEVLNVRVMRVRDISEEDALSQGIELIEHNCFKNYLIDKDWFYDGTNKKSYGAVEDPIMSFASLWDSIYAKRLLVWNLNPWAWFVDFKVIEGGGAKKV